MNSSAMHKSAPVYYKETKSPSPSSRDRDIMYLTHHHNPPRPQAALSPLSRVQSVVPQTDDVIEFCCKISKNTQIEAAVKKSKRGAAAAAGGAFIGGLVGGPPGIFIGGTLGSAVGWWMTKDQFRPLHQIIMEMSPEQKKKLYSEIIKNLKNLAWDNVSELISSVISNPSLKKKVLAILESFAKEQLRAKVKYGKK